MGTRSEILNGGISSLQLQYVARRKDAASVIEIHYLSAEMQMAAHFEYAARVGYHLVDS